MIINWGSVPANSVLPFYFGSFDSNGASVTLTGLIAGDIEVYKGTSMTQRASDNGFTLLDTDGIDVDGRTGIHGFSIDTSDNSDASFYAAGSFYTVIVDTVTIDSQTIRFVAGTFRLLAAEHTAGYPVATIKDGTGTGEIDTASGGVLVGSIAAGAITAAAIATDAIDDDAIATGAIASTAFAAGAITAAAIATDAIDNDALAANAVTEIAAGITIPSAATIADAVWDEDATAHQTQGTFGQAIGDPVADANTIFKATVTDATGATVGVDGAAILADTGTDGVVVNAASLAADAATEVATAVWALATRTLTALDEDTTTIDIDNSVWGLGTRTLSSLDEDSVTIDLDTTIRAALGLASANLDTQLATAATPSSASIATSVLTTAMTEAYAADGAAPTLAQALYLLMQHMSERSISGTTLTVKKLDGSATAATFTLDSATTPTSITRAS